MKVGLLVNPTSGKGRGKHIGETTDARLREEGFDVVPIIGRDGPHARELIDHELKSGIDALVAVGGDGLANIAVNALAGGQVPLGVVPAGTGNDLATGLALPTNDPGAVIDLIVTAMRNGSSRAVDAVHVIGPETDRWFACVLGSGFDSVVNETANRLRWPKGPQRYNVAIAMELPRFKPIAFEITVDGVSYSGPAMLVALGNAKSYGGGIKITPDAEMDDGLMDVCILAPVKKFEMVKTLPKARTGSHIPHPQITIVRGREVTLDAPGVVAYADGERFGPLPITCTSVAGALKILSAQ